MKSLDDSSDTGTLPFMKRFIPTVIAMLFAACIADNSVDAPMDIRAYRPFQAYAAVKKFAGPDVMLREIRARYVKSDGTMDMEADYNPRVVYIFTRKHPEPSDLPVGAEGGPGFQAVTVTIAKPRIGRVVRRDRIVRRKYQAYFRSMTKTYGTSRIKRRRPTTEQEPRCSIRAMWKDALAAGAPPGSVARIWYGPDGYQFRINDTDIRLYYGMDCNAMSTREFRNAKFRRRRAARTARDESQ